MSPLYAERLPAEYWLSSLKVATVVVFIILGIAVNVGANQDHEFIGAKNWHIPGAPFVGGFGGFARVFVTASFACMYIQCWGMSPILMRFQMVERSLWESQPVRRKTPLGTCLGL